MMKRYYKNRERESFILNKLLITYNSEASFNKKKKRGRKIQPRNLFLRKQVNLFFSE